jgi:hypothetical protein
MRAHHCILLAVLSISAVASAGVVDPPCTGTLASDISSQGTVNCGGMLLEDFGYTTDSLSTSGVSLADATYTVFGQTEVSDLTFTIATTVENATVDYYVAGTGANQVGIQTGPSNIEVTACLQLPLSPVPPASTIFGTCEKAASLMDFEDSLSSNSYLASSGDLSDKFSTTDFFVLTQFSKAAGDSVIEQLYVPEPSSLALIGSGLLLGVLSRRQRRRG